MAVSLKEESTKAEHNKPVNKPNVYVDLDGTLTPSDLLLESLLLLIRRNFFYCFLFFYWLFKGRWYAKQQVFSRVKLNAADIPIDDDVLKLLRQYKADGHSIILATASPITQANLIAEQINIFDRVIASEFNNLKGKAKLAAIESDSQEQPFIYFGDSLPDISIWKKASLAIAVNPSLYVRFKASLEKVHLDCIQSKKSFPLAVLKAMRLQQWAKNALLFLPLIAAHETDLSLWLKVLMVFWAFGLIASSTYILNDLMDLPSDRKHPRKKNRAIANSDLTILQAFFSMKVIALLGWLLAWFVGGWQVVGILFLYTCTTLLYTFVLKQFAFVDVLVLALLYTFRVLAGGLAVGLVVSNWLLATSLFVFLSLALVKRCAELEFMGLEGRKDLHGRGYRVSDLAYLVPMGISSGFMSVTVIALYVESQARLSLYSSPMYLWGICPLFLFWIMRIWILTSRKQMIDDPVHFAIHDRVSWCVLVLIAGLAYLAT